MLYIVTDETKITMFSHFDVRERERERERERDKPGKEQEGNNEERRHNSCARSKVSRGQLLVKSRNRKSI